MIDVYAFVSCVSVCALWLGRLIMSRAERPQRSDDGDAKGKRKGKGKGRRLQCDPDLNAAGGESGHASSEPDAHDDAMQCINAATAQLQTQCAAPPPRGASPRSASCHHPHCTVNTSPAYTHLHNYIIHHTD